MEEWLGDDHHASRNFLLFFFSFSASFAALTWLKLAVGRDRFPPSPLTPLPPTPPPLTLQHLSLPTLPYPLLTTGRFGVWLCRIIRVFFLFCFWLIMGKRLLFWFSFFIFFRLSNWFTFISSIRIILLWWTVIFWIKKFILRVFISKSSPYNLFCC